MVLIKLCVVICSVVGVLMIIMGIVDMVTRLRIGENITTILLGIVLIGLRFVFVNEINRLGKSSRSLRG